MEYTWDSAFPVTIPPVFKSINWRCVNLNYNWFLNEKIEWLQLSVVFSSLINNSFSQINENKYFMHNIVLVLWNTIREFDFFSRKESCKVFFSTKSILHFKKWFSDMFFRMNRTIKKNIFSAILPNVLCEC